MLVVAGALTLMALTVIASARTGPRLLREVRRRDPDLARGWRELGAVRREELRAAVRRGQAVADPEGARLFLRSAARWEEVKRARRPFELTSVPFVVAVTLIAFHYSITFAYFIEAAGVLFWGVTSALAWRQGLHLRRAAKATRGLHGL